MISLISPVEFTLGSILSVSLLITLLVLKVSASATAPASRWQAFGRFLNIALVPLLIPFFITVAIKINDILR